ncbi:MAG TPA: type II secretion system protein GspC [Steroidobacteraceae bacterium]|jgi:general secretion pathway protein C|nr:type II secretion system protein GspC [Steroidobacteraceae bacterium]
MNAASWMEGMPASDRWRSLLLGEGPRIATWVLALALGVQAAFIVTDLAGAWRAPRTGPAAPQPFQRRVADVGAVANAHLFGAAPAPKQDDASARPSSVQLVLTGIIAGNDPQNGLAILGPTAQTAKVHAVGDAIAGGVKLHSVYSDRVILDRNGQLESLALPHQATGAAPAPSASSLPTESPVVERMRKALTEQPGLIADLLRPQAVMDGDKVKGFRVYPGRNRLAFSRLGLRPGDEVIAINGTPLDDQDRGQAILNTLNSASEARVTVIRNNQQQELTLNIAQVAQEAETATGLAPGGFNALTPGQNGVPGAAAAAGAGGMPAAPATDTAPPPPAAPGPPPPEPAGTPEGA